MKFIYVAAFYFTAYDIVQKNPTDVFKFFASYIFSLAIVVGVTLYKHSLLEFDKGKVLLAVVPFFKDHTIYSACIAFIIPLTTGLFFSFRKEKIFLRALYFFITVLFLVGIFFSYSRAALLSILILVPFILFLKYKIKLLWIIVPFFIIGICSWHFSDDLIFYLEQNKSNSHSKFADLETQAKSVTSISADESNAERLNRWKCAVRMFSDKPFTGFGAGTYQFEYFPYQRYDDLTRISVFSPYDNLPGRGGTAHSEYLLVLSECGIFAFTFFLLFCVTVILTGRKIFLRTESKTIRLISLSVTAGLFTYLFHSMFNNFLDTDKAAFLFYSSIGTIVALDLAKE